MKTSEKWLAVDWGTSNLRVWLIGAGGEVLAARSSDQGMNGLSRDGFEPALLALVDDLLGPETAIDVLICGMAGARQGWLEAPYAAIPCRPAEGPVVRPHPRDPRLRVAILPGLKQLSPPDVMRGEETQISGLLSIAPGFDGVICLPGTHSKWVEVSAGEVVGMRTFMTGELFALLSQQSVLRHSLTGKGWNNAAFAEALGDTLSRPETAAARLFSLRAESLLHDADPATGRARLSGMLIGLELAGAKPFWLGREVVVIADEGLAKIYEAALVSLGLTPRLAPAEAMTLKGLIAAKTQLERA